MDKPRLKRYGSIASGVLVTLSVVLASAATADPMLEARVAKLERMQSEQRQSDLLLQIQQLQQEVQELRGMVEKQQYLQRRQVADQAPDPMRGQMPAPIPPANADIQTDSLGAQSAEPQIQWMSPGSSGLPPASSRAPGMESPSTTPNPGPHSRFPSLDTPGLETTPGAGTLLDLTPEDALLPSLPAPERQDGGEREVYREAFEHLKARDYDAARVAFERLLKHYPRGDFADNSRYWLGEISYQAKDYPEARAAFEQLIQNHPSSPRVPGAMLKLGYLDSDLGNIDQARTILQAVIRRFPDSAEGRLAAKRLAEIDQGAGR